MPALVDVIKFVVFYALTVFYTCWMSIILAFTYVIKRSLLEVKDRTNAPPQLTSDEYGVHKFAKVNVSFWL